MKKKWELRHCDLDLWPKVTKFNRVRASAGSSHLAKTASKSVHPFGCNFVHKNFRTHRQTDTHTHRHTDTQTNCSENITPPRFRGGVIKGQIWIIHTLEYPTHTNAYIYTIYHNKFLRFTCRLHILSDGHSKYYHPVYKKAFFNFFWFIIYACDRWRQ